jgi:hypothetical protein
MVKVRIIGEEVSNKYGASFEEMQAHRYRGGIAFKGVMEDGQRKMFFILAQGEFLNSFPLGMKLKWVGGTYYVNFYENGGYESSCGWRTWRDPYIFPSDSETETEAKSELEQEVVPMHHEVLFWELFNKYKLELYCEFIKRFDLKDDIVNVIPEQDRYFLPLLYTFVRGKRVEKGELDFIEEEYSFKTNIEVKWRGKNIMIPFYISKKRDYDVHIDYSNSTSRIITVYSGNGLINIIDQGERLVVYLRREDEDIRGWELDGEIEQPVCRIPSNSVDIDDLINRRLGDVLFIEEERANKVPYRILTNLGRVEILKGTVEANENGILISSSADEKIIVYHPEHGILTLKPGKYVLFSVPYRRRNDD